MGRNSNNLLAAITGAVMTSEAQRKVATCDFKLHIVEKLTRLTTEYSDHVEGKMGSPTICYLDTKKNGIVEVYERESNRQLSSDESDKFDAPLKESAEYKAAISNTFHIYSASLNDSNLDYKYFSGATLLGNFFGTSNKNLEALHVTHALDNFAAITSEYIYCYGKPDWHALSEARDFVNGTLLATVQYCFDELTEWKILRSTIWLIIYSIAFIIISKVFFAGGKKPKKKEL